MRIILYTVCRCATSLTRVTYLLVLQASEKIRFVLAAPVHRPGPGVLVQTRQLAIVRPGRIAALPRRVQPLYLGICITREPDRIYLIVHFGNNF